jgi:hypothetical protein
MRKALFAIWVVIVSAVTVAAIRDYVQVYWPRPPEIYLQMQPPAPPSSLVWSEV